MYEKCLPTTMPLLNSSHSRSEARGPSDLEPRACPIQDKRWMVACRRMGGQVDDFILRQVTFYLILQIPMQ